MNVLLTFLYEIAWSTFLQQKAERHLEHTVWSHTNQEFVISISNQKALRIRWNSAHKMQLNARVE